jgi:hypothetical protein
MLGIRKDGCPVCSAARDRFSGNCRGSGRWTRHPPWPATCSTSACGMVGCWPSRLQMELYVGTWRRVIPSMPRHWCTRVSCTSAPGTVWYMLWTPSMARNAGAPRRRDGSTRPRHCWMSSSMWVRTMVPCILSIAARGCRAGATARHRPSALPQPLLRVWFCLAARMAGSGLLRRTPWGRAGPTPGAGCASRSSFGVLPVRHHTSRASGGSTVLVPPLWLQRRWRTTWSMWRRSAAR